MAERCKRCTILYFMYDMDGEAACRRYYFDNPKTNCHMLRVMSTIVLVLCISGLDWGRYTVDFLSGVIRLIP